MVRTRQQKFIAESRRAHQKYYNGEYSYAHLKQNYILPYRECIGRQNYDSMRHPNRSWNASLQQIRKLYPDIPLAPLMNLQISDCPIWKRVYWRKTYLVPVITPKHIQLIGIQYMTPTSIRVCSWHSSISEKELYKCLYTYLPWVKRVHMYSSFYSTYIPTLKNMCVPLTIYGILYIHNKAKTTDSGYTDVYLLFLNLYLSLRNKSERDMYATVMDTWQSVVRPTA